MFGSFGLTCRHIFGVWARNGFFFFVMDDLKCIYLCCMSSMSVQVLAFPVKPMMEHSFPVPEIFHWPSTKTSTIHIFIWRPWRPSGDNWCTTISPTHHKWLVSCFLFLCVLVNHHVCCVVILIYTLNPLHSPYPSSFFFFSSFFFSSVTNSIYT